MSLNQLVVTDLIVKHKDAVSISANRKAWLTIFSNGAKAQWSNSNTTRVEHSNLCILDE